MGEDHDARKRSKKRRKGAATIDRELAAEGGKRNRSKKNRIRKICTGMCYQPPVLGDEDLEESGKPSPGAGPTSVERTGQKPSKRPRPGEDGTSEKGRGKRRRMSTNVLLSTVVNAPADQKGDRGGDAQSQMLDSYPQLVRGYMLQEGFTEFTPIQERVWGPLFAGKDALGVSEPGSGKTLAYILPAASRLMSGGRVADEADGVLMLVLLPTRELVQQVAGVCRTLRGVFGCRSACLYGGADKEPQLEALRKGAQIVVATPGRLLDFIDASELSLGSCRYIVIDEADKLLALGMKDQLDRLKALLLPAASSAGSSRDGKRPQVALFSATMPPDVLDVAKNWLKKPKTFRVAPSSACISRTVVQVVQVCAEHKKPAKLLKHLAQIKEKSAGMRNVPRVLIFANKIKTVNFLHQTLEGAGNKVVILHGDRRQSEREEALQAFRAGKAHIMVATDVAARGLHIRNLSYVVNYDFPSSLETYIHRVGRTGRLAAHGHAFSFFTRNLAPIAGPLLALLQDHQQTLDPNLVRLAEAYEIAAARLPAPATAEEGSEPMPLGGFSESTAPSHAAHVGLTQVDMGVPTGDGELDGHSTRKKKRNSAAQAIDFREATGAALSAPLDSTDAVTRSQGGQLQALTGAESEDEDAVLERMFRMHQKKKKLGKEDLPGLYKRRPAECSQPLHSGDEKHPKEHSGGLGHGGLKKRASLPGRLRKKLAQQKSV